MTGYNTLSDSELIAFIKDSQEPAFAELYNRYKHQLYLHAYRMLQDEEEAKDVVQEMFSSVWEKREYMATPAAVNAYLYSCLRNKILNVIAHKKVIDKYSVSFSNYMEKGMAAPDEKIIAKELVQLIESEVAILPPKMRQVFEMSRNQCLSHKQIAEQLNISDKTVKKQVGYALKILRLKLSLNSFFSFFL